MAIGQKWERLHDMAVDELIAFFGNKRDQSPDTHKRARIASAVLSTYAKLEQAEGAQNALAYAMQRDGLVGAQVKRQLASGGR